MIGSTRQIRVFVHREPVDMRKQYDSLAVLVSRSLGADALSGDLYVFVGRTRKRAKVLYWDGTGLCLFAKRLEKGLFIAPWAQPSAGPLAITTTELALLLEGSELVGRTPLSPSPFPLAANGFGFVRRREHIE